MADTTKHLEISWKKRSEEAKEKALKTIQLLKSEGGAVNFNSVHMRSGVSKNYLYKEPEIREHIEACRQSEKARSDAWHSKYDKSSKSKDVIIEAKDKRIVKLESENKKLRHEVEVLRGMLYEKK